MEYIKISIASDFSKTPGPRYREEGDFSGEEFLEKIMIPTFEKALQENKKIIVNLDGTLGYGTSFLEETFGGLARKYTSNRVHKIIEIISKEEEYLKEDIKGYINDANK